MSQRFEDIFSKYAGGKEYLTLGDMFKVWRGQMVLFDGFGALAEGLECKYLPIPPFALLESWYSDEIVKGNLIRECKLTKFS